MACSAGLNNAMDETRAGVKERLEVPVIDLSGVADDGGGRREVVVEQIRRAAESWGLFQVVGHGVPATVLDEMIASGRRFHEGEKAACNSPDDRGRRVSYTSHLDVYPSRDPNWRDTLFCSVAPNPLPPEELPAICREAVLQYWRHVSVLADTLFQLLSEALGLGPSHLEDMECHKGSFLVCHYYPECPEAADLTLGTVSHCDNGFLTILLQDDAGGLQVLYQDRWVDVPPMVGALVVNLGDFMQLITNDRFKSAEHKVVAKKQSTRVSVASFFTTYPFLSSTRLYGPIKDLLSYDNPARYMETSMNDYTRNYNSTGLTGESALSHFKL